MKLLAFLFLIPLFLSSCGDSNSTGASLRFVQLSPDTEQVDIYENVTFNVFDGIFNADLLINGLNYNQNNSIFVGDGSFTFNVFNAEDDPQHDDSLIDIPLNNLNINLDYTVFIIGLASINNSNIGISYASYAQNATAPSDGKAQFRVIHLSPDTSDLFVFVAGSDAEDLNDDGTINDDDSLTYQADSNYIEVDPGEILVEVDFNSDGNSPSADNTFTMSEGKTYTVYLHGCSSPSASGCGSNDLALSMIED